MRFAGADGLTVMSRIVKFDSGFSFDCAKAVSEELMKMPADFDRRLAENGRIIGEKMDRSRIHLGRPEDNVLSGEELLRACPGDTLAEQTLCKAIANDANHVERLDLLLRECPALEELVLINLEEVGACPV